MTSRQASDAVKMCEGVNMIDRKKEDIAGGLIDIIREDHPLLLGIRSEMIHHLGEPFVLIERKEICHTESGRTQDHVLEENARAAVCFTDTIQVSDNASTLIFSCLWPVSRTERYAHKWTFDNNSKDGIVFRLKGFEDAYRNPLKIVNEQNRRSEGEDVFALDLLVGSRNVQRYLMQETLGLDILTVDHMIINHGKHPEEMSRLYRGTVKQWNGLLKALKLHDTYYNEERHGLIPEIKSISGYGKRWYWPF